MKIHVLGTGSADTIKCYNTCWCLENNGKYLLVDGGGGNQILSQLEKADISILDIHNVFISHIHTDHILGLVWIIRIVTHKILLDNNYIGTLNVYGDKTSIDILKYLVETLFPVAKKVIDSRILFYPVEDGETVNIIDLPITFMNTGAKNITQFGFYIEKKLAFCGDMPLTRKDAVFNCEWLLHEAYCLDKEEQQFKAHFKNHSTVKDAAEIATLVNAKNLIMWHSVDNRIETRKLEFTQEAKQYFNGNVYAPNDLEVIEI